MTARFLALGDSYTIGEGVEPQERWPAQLVAMLRDRGFAVAEPEIVATTGWTTDELAKGIDAAAPVGPFELVSLLIGVNNQYRGWPVVAYRAEFGALLRRAVVCAGGDAKRVLVLSIPDWGATPFAEGRDTQQIRREIEGFNDVNREECAVAGSRYVDVTAVSRAAASDGSLVCGDGLHPSGAMHQRWAQLTLPAAEAALSAEGM